MVTLYLTKSPAVPVVPPALEVWATTGIKSRFGLLEFATGGVPVMSKRSPPAVVVAPRLAMAVGVMTIVPLFVRVN